MNEIAVFTGSITIYWSAIVITLGMAAGLCLTLALIRLSSLFNTTCRGRIVINNEAYQRLPWAVSWTATLTCALAVRTAARAARRVNAFFISGVFCG